MRASLLLLFAGLLQCLSPIALAAEAVKVETLLQTSQSWDGTPYQAYSGGQPEPTLVKFSIPAHTTLAWHTHAVVNVGYVLVFYANSQGLPLSTKVQEPDSD